MKFLTLFSDTQTHGNSKFYDSSENLSGRTLKDIFFELECSVENRQMCRDIFCIDPEREYGEFPKLHLLDYIH